MTASAHRRKHAGPIAPAAGQPEAIGAEPVRVALGYVRVSQATEDTISPAIQRDHMAAWAQSHSVSLGEVIEDLDLSGRTFKDRQIGRIIAKIEAGEVDMMLVYNYSRFGRNAHQSLVNIARIEDVGGQVQSVTEPGDPTTAFGKYNRTQILALAELQSDQIRDGWRASMAQRVKRGLPGAGRNKYGYVYHRASVPAGKQCPRGCVPGACTTGYVVDPVTGPQLAVG